MRRYARKCAAMVLAATMMISGNPSYVLADDLIEAEYLSDEQNELNDSYVIEEEIDSVSNNDIRVEYEEDYTAEDASEYILTSADVDFDKGIIKKYNRNDYSNIVIPSTIGGITVIGIGNGAFRDHTELVNVAMPSTLLTIENYAFCGVSFGTSRKLGNVVIPKNVNRIGAGAFKSCNWLGEVIFEEGNNISEGITFDTSIGEASVSNVFAECKNLGRIVLSENVKSISEGFVARCEKLNEVVTTSELTVLKKGAFSGCSSLKKCDLSKTKVAVIADELFNGCPNVDIVALPSTIETIGKRAFGNVSVLVKSGVLELPQSITRIDAYAFQNCTGLTKVVFENVAIGDKEVAYGTEWTEYNCKWFEGCSNLVEIDLSENIVTIPPGMAVDCGKLQTVKWPRSLKVIKNNAFKNCSNLTSNDFSNTSLEVIEDDAFNNDTNMQAPIFPRTLNSIGGSAFASCNLGTDKNRGTLFIPNSVENVGAYSFAKAKYLERVVFEDSPEWDTLVNGIQFPTMNYGNGSEFEECINLKSIYLSNNVKIVPQYMTRRCNKLTDITINRSDATINEGAFYTNAGSKVRTALATRSSSVKAYDWSKDNRVIIRKYNIVFNSNYPVAIENTTISQMGEINSNIILNGNTFTNDMYIFAGWNTRPDGTGTSYANKAQVKNIANEDETIVLYAQWKPYVYYVKYDANVASTSNSKAQGTMTKSKYAINDSAAKLARNSFAIEGYMFGGWSNRADGKGAVNQEDEGIIGTKFVDNGYIHNNGDVVTLYAQWIAKPYSVTFKDTNGDELYNTENNQLEEKYDLYYNQKLNSIDLNLLKNKTGYTLQGWYTQPNGLGKKYAVNAKNIVKAGQDVCLYAQWKKNTYTIKYNLDGGKIGKGNPQKYNVETENIILKNPSKIGYEFAGWMVTSEGAKISGTISAIPKGTYGNLVLKALWTPITYTIRMYEDGGKNVRINGGVDGVNDVNDRGNYSEIVVKYDDVIDFYSMTKDRFEIDNESNGNSITGWSLVPNSNRIKYSLSLETSKLKTKEGELLELYPVVGAKVYTVKYENMDDAVNYKSNPKKYVYSTKNAVSIKKPSKKGYVFTGWEQIAGDANAYDAVNNKINKGAQGDIILSAKWTPVKYTVKLNKNNSKAIFTSDAKLIYGANPGYINYETTEVIDSDILTNKYYDFVGWNTKANGKGEYLVKNGDGTFNLSGINAKDKATVTIYAIWIPKTYSIKYVNVDPDSYGAGEIRELNCDNSNSSTFTISKSLTIKDSKRYGFTFGGWYLHYNNETGEFSDRVKSLRAFDESVINDGKITLYSKWKAKN